MIKLDVEAPLLDEEDEYLLDKEFELNLAASRLALGPRPDICRRVLRAVDLEGLYDFLDAFNPAANAPFHNASLVAGTVTLAYEAAIVSALPRTACRTLVAAASLQHFNHGAGTTTNADNLKRSLEGVRNGARALACTRCALTAGEIADIERLIKAVYRPQKHPVEISEGLLRDCGQMLPYWPPDDAVRLLQGLRQERGAAGHVESTATFAQQLRSEYEAVRWRTGWAKLKASRMGWQGCVDRVCGGLVASADPALEKKGNNTIGKPR